MIAMDMHPVSLIDKLETQLPTKSTRKDHQCTSDDVSVLRRIGAAEIGEFWQPGFESTAKERENEGENFCSGETGERDEW